MSSASFYGVFLLCHDVIRAIHPNQTLGFSSQELPRGFIWTVRPLLINLAHFVGNVRYSYLSEFMHLLSSEKCGQPPGENGL